MTHLAIMKTQERTSVNVAVDNSLQEKSVETQSQSGEVELATSSRTITPESSTPPAVTPLPKLQLAIVLFMQLSEPVVFKIIFPFVNQFVRGTGITNGDQAKTGYYSGLIESCFYATEALAILSWGRASDRFGRKPIMLIGLFGLAVSTVSFGFSHQFWSAVLARCAEGALCGNMGVVKSALAELSDSTNRAKAFSLISIIWIIGSTFSPIVAGVLAEPADRWPDTIGRLRFFREYPYILPCMIAACVPLISGICGAAFLKETHPNPKGLAFFRKRRVPDEEKSKSADINLDSAKQCPESELEKTPTREMNYELEEMSKNKSGSSTIRSLLHRRLLISVVNYALLAFVDQILTVLVPLVYSSKPSLGGLNFSSFTIGIVLGVWGVINGIFNICFVPGLIRRFGTKRLFVVSTFSMLVSLLMFIAINTIGKQVHNDDAVVGGKAWAAIVIQLVCWVPAFMGYTCIFVFINEGVDDQSRGTVNGLAQMAVSTVRAIAPISASSLSAVTMQSDLAGGNLVYIVLAVIPLLCIFMSFQLHNQ